MKTPSLLLTALLSGAMLAGCIDLSSDDKEELSQAAAAFLDGYEEEQNEDVSTSEALEKNYIEETEVTEESASGSARIGGEIDVESLNRSLAKMSSRAMGSRAQLAARAVDAISATNFSVSFINGKGQLVELTIAASDILIHQPDTGNPQFIIEGMGDGINYIIDVNLTVDGEAVDLKTLAFVPPGETKSEKAVMDPISTVISQAIKDKVVNSFFETGGDTLAQSYIADLTETLAVSIEEALVDNPDLSASDFETAIESDSGVDDLVAKLLSDDDIAGDLNKIEDAAVADTFAVPEDFATGEEGQVEARNIVEELLNSDDDGEGGGAPQFFVDFFGDQYQLGTLKTVSEIMGAIFNGIDFEDTPAEVLAELTTANALSAFTTELNDIYAALDTVATLEDKDTLSDAEKTELQNLRDDLSGISLFLGIFPPERKTEWQNLSGSSDLNVPQAISLIFFVLDTYLADLKSVERNDDGQLEESDGVDFDPIALLEAYGFDTTNGDQQALYANLEVNWLDLHPGRVWLSTANDGAGGEVDVLNLFTCVDAYPEELFDVASVSLTYPTATGTATVELTNESDLYGDNSGGDATGGGEGGEGGGHKNTCFTLNPWAEADILANSGNPEYGNDDQGGLNYDAIWRDLVDSGVVVTDFVSGDYVVTVEYSKEDVDQTDYTNTFDRRIITGLSGLYPKFTSPLGFPRFPEGNASPAEYEAFNEAVNSFNMTTFATADAAIFTWDAPALLATTPLPEGIIPVYNLDIGRDVCSENSDGFNQCQWEHVFSSWETGSQIFGTTFELPQEGKDKLLALELTDTPYQANLNINFIDENTGEFVGSGGWAQAPFRVGETLDLTQTFNLTGNVTGAPDANLFDPDTNEPYLISQYKVAAVKEGCEEDTDAEPFVDSYFDEELGQFVSVEYFPWICTSETLAISSLTEDATNGGHTYTVMPTLQEMMGNSQNSWIDIRMFIDADGDGLIDQGTEENNYFGEPQFWSMSHVNFNSWGGVLRASRDICDDNGCQYSEEIVIPGETYEGPDFDVEGNDNGGGDGGDNGGDQNINAFFMPAGEGGDFLDNAIEWNLSPNIKAEDVAGYRVVLFSVDPSTADAEPEEARIVEVPKTMGTITLEEMFGDGANIEDITTEVLAEENAAEGSAIIELTADNLTDDKTYIWIIEAFDDEGNDIGESNDVFLSPPPPTNN